MKAKEKLLTLFQKLKFKIMIDYVLEYEIEKLENWLDDLKNESPNNILLAQRAIKRYKEDAPSCISGLPEPDIYSIEKRNRLIREIEEKISEYRLAERRKRKGLRPISVINEDEQNISHYNKNDELKAKRQFENLVKEGYFSPETSLDDWFYIYGVDGKEPNKKPLEWKKTQIELAYMVRLIWQNTDTRQWVICERVFTIKGKAPNTDTMKSELSKIDNENKNRPKTFDKLDKLLKC